MSGSLKHFVMANSHYASLKKQPPVIINSLKVESESEVEDTIVIKLLGGFLSDGSKINSIDRTNCMAQIKTPTGRLLKWKYSFAHVGTNNGPAINYYPLGFTGMSS